MTRIQTGYLLVTEFGRNCYSLANNKFSNGHPSGGLKYGDWEIERLGDWETSSLRLGSGQALHPSSLILIFKGKPMSKKNSAQSELETRLLNKVLAGLYLELIPADHPRRTEAMRRLDELFGIERPSATELRLPKTHKRVVRLQSQSGDAERSGQVSVRDLVINAMRMRPDRLIVGEIRGGEAIDFLQAMNTGHDGSMVQDIFKFQETGVENGRVLGQYMPTGYIPSFLKKLHTAGATVPMSLFMPQ